MSIEVRYIEAATAHGASSENGDIRSNHRAYDRLVALRKELYALDDRGESILLRLAEHANPHVCVSAAYSLLAVNEGAAVAVLERIAASDRGMAGFNAEMVLERRRDSVELTHDLPWITGNDAG